MTPVDGQAAAAQDRMSGGRLVASDGRPLPLCGITLRADARGGLARVALHQRFVNAHAEPLRVTYLVPLPADAVLAGYAFRIGQRRIAGEVDRARAARERFERALLEGRSAGLVEQERPNLFTLEIGNVPPGVEVVAELAIDQPLAWLDEGAWEWRFPTVVAPRYLGADGRVADAGRVVADVAEGGLAVDTDVTLVIREALPAETRPVSPSHELAVVAGAGGLEVRPSDPIALDRDLVVRWAAASAAPGLTLDVARPPAGRPHAGAAYGLLTVTPAGPESRRPALARDLIALIDTSGSMDGEPLAQARAVVAALVESLRETDRLELIAFSSAPRRWRRTPVPATDAARREAREWLAALEAGGGTEMHDAVVEALRPLRSGAQRQVVLVTDGLVGFESEIVGTLARDLPAGSRLHAVGVGSAVNRALTAPAARAGRGTEVVIGLGEPVEAHVARLLARMREPVLTEVKVWGSALLDHAPRSVPDVHAGAPLRLALRLRPGGGDLHVHALTPGGAWDSQVAVPAMPEGQGSEAVINVYGRESVEDLEVMKAAGLGAPDADIERIGLEFQIATRLTSWVAVSEEPSVDPRQPTRRRRIPHALPHGLSIEGLGLRSAVSPMLAAAGTSLLAEPSGPYGPTAAYLDCMSALPATDRTPVSRRAGPHSPVPRWLAGRLVLREGSDLILEIDPDEDLDWSPDDVEVVWADGTVAHGEVVAEHTTAPARLASGLVVRLAVRLAAGAPATPPERVQVRSQGRLLLVRVLGA